LGYAFGKKLTSFELLYILTLSSLSHPLLVQTPLKASMSRLPQPIFPRHVALAFCVASTLVVVSGGAESIVLVRPHGENRHFDRERGPGYTEKAALTEQFTANGLTFNIAYDDIGSGFTDPVGGSALRTRLESVLAYVATIVNYTERTLDLRVEASEFDGTGALATAGTFYPAIPGVHTGSSFQRLETGIKPFLGFPEITIMVDLGFPWNVDSGLPEPHEADFFSVLLHEITHGLGFASVIASDGTSELGLGNYTTYDQFLFDPGQNRRLLSNEFPPTFQGGESALTNGQLVFDGPESFALYNVGARVPVYSPSPMEPGSSLSHWDVARLADGAVMTHSITLGTTRREYAAVDLGALEDLGYDNFGGEPGGGCALAKWDSGSVSRADIGALVIGVGLGVGLLVMPGATASASE
jgi:hypothetical protein